MLPGLLLILLLSGCASTPHIVPNDSKVLVTSDYTGKWAGKGEYDKGNPFNVTFTLIESPYSEREGVKNDFFQNVAEVTGIMDIDIINKRDDVLSCKALEELHWVFTGRRFGKKIFLHNLTMEAGTLMKANFVKINLDSPDKLVVFMDDYIAASRDFAKTQFNLTKVQSK